jgi:hypothetical protein
VSVAFLDSFCGGGTKGYAGGKVAPTVVVAAAVGVRAVGTGRRMAALRVLVG